MRSVKALQHSLTGCRKWSHVAIKVYSVIRACAVWEIQLENDVAVQLCFVFQRIQNDFVKK